jgi:hypothetical protein
MQNSKSGPTNLWVYKQYPNHQPIYCKTQVNKTRNNHSLAKSKLKKKKNGPTISCHKKLKLWRKGKSLVASITSYRFEGSWGWCSFGLIHDDLSMSRKEAGSWAFTPRTNGYIDQSSVVSRVAIWVMDIWKSSCICACVVQLQLDALLLKDMNGGKCKIQC